MTNTSASGGYLAPIGTQLAEDTDLDSLIQPMIAGITGLAGNLVRPKWQAVPPAQPDRTITWCAFGVSVTEADTYPTLVHDGCDANGLGTTTEFRTEYLEMMASFYGPSCRAAAATLRDGLGISQNREALRASGLAFVQVERMTRVPDLQNTQFVNRVDIVVRFRRVVIRTYGIENVLSAQGDFIADQGSFSGQ